MVLIPSLTRRKAAVPVRHAVFATLESKNFIRRYRNTGNHFLLYAFPLVPQDFYPSSDSGITGRTLMGTGRLEKAKSASQNESE